MSSNSYISVIIPAHNEQDSLPLVLKDIPLGLVNDVIVVNNASTDQTVEKAKECGARVIDEMRMGYGQACLSGIKSLNPKTDIVVFIDGDHSDHAQQLKDLVEPIIESDYDFVIGSRALGMRDKGAMTPQAFFGNKLACFLMKLFWKVEYTDLGPFRAIRYESLKSLGMIDCDFGWTIEMQIKAVEQGLRIKEVPVNYRKRIGKSKISGTAKGTILAGEKILRTIFKYKFSK
ncbi:MAG: glycosyltransferase involved in cell wall biosynthesis [Lysobacterales bacterium]|jgi:glycosyltransferase involved in cell wall biosynthesis